MKKIELPKENDYGLEPNAHLLEHKLAEIKNGCTKSYTFEYAYEIGIKHSIEAMCCELKNFTDIVDPSKSTQIDMYKHEWGIEKWNLNKHNLELAKEINETNNLVNYIYELKVKYELSKRRLAKVSRKRYKDAIEKLSILQTFFENLSEIINITMNTEE